MILVEKMRLVYQEVQGTVKTIQEKHDITTTCPYAGMFSSFMSARTIEEMAAIKCLVVVNPYL